MRIIAVDDEPFALDDFQYTCSKISGITDIRTFENPADALRYARVEKIDVAFLDIEMPVMSGIELAKKLHQIDSNIKIVFVTGFTEYALDAFGVDAIGYVLKPYSAEMIEQNIIKASHIINIDSDKKITVKTFGHFDVFVNGKIVHFASAKSKELLALLIDRRGGTLSTEQAIGLLWADREYDDSVQSLFRKVLKSLRVALNDADISEILIDARNQRSVDTSLFECDSYALLEGDKKAIKDYYGQYMSEYSWSGETRKRLNSIVKEANN